MQIHGYNKLSLLDYPEKLACTIFTGGCNFRCPFCHNASLVLSPGSVPAIPEEEILSHLASRKGMLEGACITGGEPTLNRDLPEFAGKLRELGLLVKLDTNGTNPKVVENLICSGLIDYVAMDIKASPDNYAAATGTEDLDMGSIFSTAELLMNSNIGYEFRTTVVKGIHTVRDFEKIGKWLKGAERYFLQCYKDSGELIAPKGLGAPSKDELLSYREAVLPYIPNTCIRGID